MEEKMNAWTSEDASEYFDESGQFELAMAQFEIAYEAWS
jgi:hypothetical protein